MLYVFRGERKVPEEGEVRLEKVAGLRFRLCKDREDLKGEAGVAELFRPLLRFCKGRSRLFIPF